MSRIYRLYVTGSSSANNIANVQILQTARIKSVRWMIAMRSKVDLSEFYLEASLQGSSQGSSNNTIGVFDTLRATCNFVTSGMYQGAVWKQSFLDCPVKTGDLIYVNAALAAGTVTWVGDIFLDCTS